MTSCKIAVLLRKHESLGVLGTLFLLAAFSPMTTFAQAFVPVKDIELNPAFSTYAADTKAALTGASDSLRDIIAGSDPGGVAKEICKKDDAEDKAFAYTEGPWADAIAATSTAPGLQPLPSTVPAEGGFVQVNKSGSLRCILQDLIGYQKISLFVQIQALLKQYITDAQQQALSNQLLNKINATNLNWARQGEQVTAGGVQITEPVYVLNSDQSQYARNTRTAQTVIDQAASADPNDPIGSLGLCNPLQTATAVAINTRDETEDPRNFVIESTKCSLNTTDGGPFTGSDQNASFANYMEDANTPDGLGAVYTFAHMLNNPQDTPIGAAMIVQGEVERRLAQDEKSYAEARANSGFQPTQKCSGLASDPNCDPALMTNISSAAQNEQTVVSAVESGKEQVADANILDSTSAASAENLSTDANTGEGGVAGYDTTALGSSQTAVNTLIYELYDTISYAYFDLDKDQEDWAQAALLSIYDTMLFNDQTPAIVTPGAATDDTFTTVQYDF